MLPFAMARTKPFPVFRDLESDAGLQLAPLVALLQKESTDSEGFQGALTLTLIPRCPNPNPNSKVP